MKTRFHQIKDTRLSHWHVTMKSKSHALLSESKRYNDNCEYCSLTIDKSLMGQNELKLYIEHKVELIYEDLLK